MATIKENIKLYLTKEAIRLNPVNSAALEKVISNRLEQARLNTLTLAKRQQLIDRIFERIASHYKKLSNPNGSPQQELKQFIIEAIDEAIVDYVLQQKFPNRPQISQHIKYECSFGKFHPVKNKLALLLAKHIDETISVARSGAITTINDAIQTIIDTRLYPDDEQSLDSQEMELVNSAATLRQAQAISQEITQQILTKNRLKTHYLFQQSKSLHQELSVKDKKHLINEEGEENFEQLTEFSAEISEIIKLSGEFVEKSHHLHTMSHAAEASSKALTKTGGIGTLIAGVLGAFSLPVLCAIEKRKPSLPEVGMIGLSTVMIVLGALATAAVGGPIGVGAFVLSAAVIGLGKTMLNYYKDFRERRHLKKQVKGITQQQNTLEFNLSTLKTKLNTLQIALDEQLNGPPNLTNHNKIKRLHKRLNTLNTKASQLTNTLNQLNNHYAKASVKLAQLNKLHASVWHHATTGIYASSGLLGITGAALMLTPAAPVGVALMIAASALSIATMATSFIAKRVKRYQAKKAQREASVLNVLESPPGKLKPRHAPQLTNNKQMSDKLGNALKDSKEDKLTKKVKSPHRLVNKEAINEENYGDTHSDDPSLPPKSLRR